MSCIYILTARVRTLVHNCVDALHHIRLFVTTAKTHGGHFIQQTIRKIKKEKK